ncbi:MAG TPA: hypothetical protein VGE01_05280 [Fimbriimonas sp.]
MDPLELLAELVAAYGPPGQEDEVRGVVERRSRALGYECATDEKGNLLIGRSRIPDQRVRLLVTAHLDEIAIIVRRIEPDGRIRVTSLGGMWPWKLGEGPVELLGAEPLPGVLSFGGIHTEDPASPAVIAKEKALTWEMATVFAGCSAEELQRAGITPGTRVVVPKERRRLWRMGDYVAGYFLDDRADLAAMLLVLEMLGEIPDGAVFCATAAEEVGGVGARSLMHRLLPDVCLALELAPMVTDAPIRLDENPVLWVNDGYAAPHPEDNDRVAQVAREIGIDLQYQALSRGGSDASCGAAHGLCARPITLGIPMENSHGFEIMHEDGIVRLAQLTAEMVRRL